MMKAIKKVVNAVYGKNTTESWSRKPDKCNHKDLVFVHGKVTAIGDYSLLGLLFGGVHKIEVDGKQAICKECGRKFSPDFDLD